MSSSLTSKILLALGASAGSSLDEAIPNIPDVQTAFSLHASERADGNISKLASSHIGDPGDYAPEEAINGDKTSTVPHLIEPIIGSAKSELSKHEKQAEKALESVKTALTDLEKKASLAKETARNLIHDLEEAKKCGKPCKPEEPAPSSTNGSEESTERPWSIFVTSKSHSKDEQNFEKGEKKDDGNKSKEAAEGSWSLFGTSKQDDGEGQKLKVKSGKTEDHKKGKEASEGSWSLFGSSKQDDEKEQSLKKTDNVDDQKQSKAGSWSLFGTSKQDGGEGQTLKKTDKVDDQKKEKEGSWSLFGTSKQDERKNQNLKVRSGKMADHKKDKDKAAEIPWSLFGTPKQDEIRKGHHDEKSEEMYGQKKSKDTEVVPEKEKTCSLLERVKSAWSSTGQKVEQTLGSISDQLPSTDSAEYERSATTKGNSGSCAHFHGRREGYQGLVHWFETSVLDSWKDGE